MKQQLTDNELTLLLNYKLACERLNSLHAQRNSLKLLAWERAAADAAYYQTMTYCDDLLWELGKTGIDAETMLAHHFAASGNA